MAELDKLEIVVTADTKGAESSISSLLRKLEELQQKISGLSGNGVGKKINGISKAFGKNGALKSIKAASKQAAAYQEKLDLENFRQQNRLALEAVKHKNRLEQMSERARLSDARTAAKKAEREATKAAKEDPYWNDAALKARNEEVLNRLFPTVQAVKTRIKGISSISAFRNGIFAKSDSQQAEDFRYHSSDYFNRARSRRYQQELSARSSTASSYDAGAENYTDKYNAVTDALHKVGATAKETQQRLAELHQEMGNNTGGVEIAQGFGIQESVFSRIGAALNSTMNQVPGFTNALASALPVLSSLASAAGRLAMTGLGKFFQASISPIVSFGKRIQGVTSGVMGLFKQFKRLALLRLFRTAIAEIGKGLSTGINNLYQYSSAINGSFKSALDSAATSMQYFRNSIGAAAAPLIQTFIPYLNAAVSAIVSFINIINQLLAALGGAFKFTRAKKSLTEFGKAAGGAGGGAGKAAKEMDKFLASWDEITNIKTPNDSGGGGGGGGGAGDFLDMFEEAAIDPELLDFASKIREAFEAGRWEDVGKIIADKLNEIMPDDAIFENWGRRFGEKINMAFGIALGFLRNFDFKALGSRIASFLNGGIDEVNWNNIGAYLWRRLSSAFDIAIGFISTFDTKGATTAISNLLIGMWNETTAWLGETDWSEFGRTVARKLLDAIAGIKWRELITSAWELMKAAVSATWDFFSGFVTGLFSELWEDIKAGLAETEIGKAFIEWWNQVEAVWGPVAEWFNTNVIGPVKEFFAPLGEAITGFLKDPIGTIQQAWAEEVEWWSTNVIEPIKMKFAPIKEAIEGFLNDPIGTIQQAWTSVAEWFSMTVIEPLKLVFEPIKAAIEGFLNDPIGTIQTAWTTFAEWFNTTFIIPVTTYFNSLKASIELGFEAAKQFIMDSWLTVAEWFNTTIITPVVNYFNSLKANIELAFEAAKQFVTDAWSTVSEWFSTNVTQPIYSFFSPLEEAIAGFLSNPVGVIKQAWADIKQWFQDTIITPISDAFSGLGETIKSAFFGGINAVIGGLNSFIGMVNNVGIDWDGFQQSVNVFGHTLNWGIPGVHLKPFNLPTIPTLEYASGGFPTEGEMFIAREAGPELVGRMGNRSTVANNDQIVEGIRQGVYEAMVAANNGQNSREVKVYIDGKDITDYTRKRSNQMARALGV